MSDPPRRPCLWCGRQSPKAFREVGLMECNQPDCEQAQRWARGELALGGAVLTHVQAGCVQRLVRADLGLPLPTAAEVPAKEWFEGLEGA